MARRTSLGDFERSVLLAIYRIGEHAYGTTIIEEVEVISGREAALGAVYTTLKRLENKGLIESQLGEATPERGGRAKRYFAVTKSGELALDEVRKSLQRLNLVYAPESL